MELHTGYNDLKQLEMFVETAQKMVGSATMSLDRDMLAEAKQSIANAYEQLTRIRSERTGVDDSFLAKCEQRLKQAEHQLNEALQ